MNDNSDYSATITVNATASEAYQALTSGFENWWTTPSNIIKKIGDQAKFSFPPGKTYWTFEATHLEPNSAIEMTCVDALHIHQGFGTDIQQEWLHTKLKWQIEESADQTKIHLTHEGLKSQLLCFDICRAGWDFFFLKSLKCLLDTGKGMAHKPD
jgi:hypothetical protein